MTPGRWLGVFVGVAIAGTLGDRWFHHALGVLHYPTPAQPPTVLLTMGVAGLAVVAWVQALDRAWPWPKGPPAGAAVVADAVAGLAAYGLTGLFAGADLALTTGLIVAWAVRSRGRPPQSVANALALAVAGPLAEALLILAGVFRYDEAHASRLLVPVWLPALYLHVGLAGESVGRWVRAGEGLEAARPGVTG